MLTFESPFYEIEGVVVFRDHASPTTFHYLAGPPRLTRGPDNRPHLLMLKYRHALEATDTTPRLREQLGGAFLMFGVDCGIPEDTKRSIERRLLRSLPADLEADQVTLVPVLYTAGRVDVIALDKQTAVETAAEAAQAASGKFVRGILGTSTPSLLQDQRAIFSIALTPDAATLLEEAYESELSPIGVMYSLTFSGLRPAISVKAWVDQKRVYEQLKLGVHIGVGSGGGQRESGGGQGSGGSPPPATPTEPAGGGQPGSPPADGATPPAPGGDAPPADGATPPAPGGDAPPADGATPPAPGGDAAPADPPPSDGGGAPPADGGAPPPGEGTPTPGDGGAAAGGETSAAVVDATPAEGATPPAGGATPGPEGGTGTGDRSSSETESGRSDSQSRRGTTQVAVGLDLSFTLEKLKQSGAIRIEIVRQQEGQSVEQMERNAMQLLQESILKDFFRPAMTDHGAASGIAGATAAASSAVAAASGLAASTSQTSTGTAGSDGTKVDIGFQLKYVKQEELREATYDYTVQAPETRTHAPNGFFSALVSATEREKHIRQIDLDDEFFKRLLVDVSSTEGFDDLDLKVVKVDWKYDAKPVQTITLNPAPSPRSFFEEFLDGSDASYEYRLSYLFGQSEAIAAQTSSYETPWRSEVTRALVVHPADDVSMLRVYLEPGVVDWEVVERIQTTLTYEDAANGFRAERTYLVSQGSERQHWTVRLTNPGLRTYQVQNTWHLKDHSTITGAPEPHDEAHLFVPDPFVDRLPIVIQTIVDPANVRRVDVKIDYEDRANDFEVHKTERIDGPDFEQVRTLLPIMDPRRRKYTYTVTLIKTSGQAEMHEPKTTDDLSIVVTEGGAYLHVQVTLLGDLTQLGVSAVQVDLRSEPLAGQREKVESHLFVPGAEAQVGKTLLLRADRPSQFDYRMTVFTAQGQRATDWIGHASQILVLQPQTLLGG
jgi:hypothetical protein